MAEAGAEADMTATSLVEKEWNGTNHSLNPPLGQAPSPTLPAMAEFPPIEINPTGDPSRHRLTCGPLRNLDDTQWLARGLARVLEAGDLVTLTGPMGSGKTTLTHFLSVALGAESAAVSPTFALQRVLDLPPSSALTSPCQLVHYDLFRIDDPRELEGIGFGYEDEGAAVIVEWPERCPGLESRATLGVTLRLDGDESRFADIEGPESRLNVLRDRLLDR